MSNSNPVEVEIDGRREIVEFADLEVQDCIEVGTGYRKVATEYRLKGKLVKRTVSIDGLVMPGSQSAQGKLNG